MNDFPDQRIADSSINVQQSSIKMKCRPTSRTELTRLDTPEAPPTMARPAA